VRRPGRFTTCSRALLCFPHDTLSMLSRSPDYLGADEEPLSEDIDPDGDVDDEAPEDVLGLVAELDDDGDVLELDVDPELGVLDGLVDDDEDEVDGDGLTTGGVDDGEFVPDSRWQPAIPNARPAHSNVTSVLLIVISTVKVERRACVCDLADSVPCKHAGSATKHSKFRLRNSTVSNRLHAKTTVATSDPPTRDVQISLLAGNNYADSRGGRTPCCSSGCFRSKIQAHAVERRTRYGTCASRHQSTRIPVLAGTLDRCPTH
jgi:hypothetical protein